ncbi:hypothetical protein [Dyella humicola]|nr:hypothetical protein [Dyella humicola]
MAALADVTQENSKKAGKYAAEWKLKGRFSSSQNAVWRGQLSL